MSFRVHFGTQNKLRVEAEILQDFFQKATTLENQFHEQLKTLAVAAVTNFEEEQGDLEGSDQRDPRLVLPASRLRDIGGLPPVGADRRSSMGIWRRGLHHRAEGTQRNGEVCADAGAR